MTALKDVRGGALALRSRRLTPSPLVSILGYLTSRSSGHFVAGAAYSSLVPRHGSAAAYVRVMRPWNFAKAYEMLMHITHKRIALESF